MTMMGNPWGPEYMQRRIYSWESVEALLYLGAILAAIAVAGWGFYKMGLLPT